MIEAYLIPIVIIIVLILLNGLFVAAEFAIIGVRATRIAQLAEAGNRTAAAVKRILDNPMQQDRYIATAQIGITAASLGLGMYGEHTVSEWLLGPLEAWIHLDEGTAHALAAVVAVSLMTFAHVVVGEMVPKSLALQYAEQTVLGISGIMAWMKRLLFPAVITLNTIGNGLLRLLGIPTSGMQGRLYSVEELALIVEESHEGGLLTDSEELLLHNIFDFSERQVGQVMTPRPRIAAVPIDISEEELRDYVAQSPHSRFPVYEEDLDHIIGLLVVRDFVRQQVESPGQFNLRSLLRFAPMVPESMPVGRLLAAFKRSHIHMAIVFDEYGSTVGLVTLEDLVEEVVGEVRDEFDPAELPPLREVTSGVLVARGDLLLDDLRELAPDVLPEPEEEEDDFPDVDTVGGLVVTMLGRPPRPGDRVEIHDADWEVIDVNGLAVKTVRITAKVPKESGRPGAQR